MDIKYLVNMTYIFQMAAILLFSLFASSSNLVILRAFINGTVMHLFLGYPHQRNYASVTNIRKVMNF